MNEQQPWIAPLVDAVQVTVAGQAGPLPSGVGLEALPYGNLSHLTDEEIQRLILDKPSLLRPASSNFDLETQVKH